MCDLEPVLFWLRLNLNHQKALLHHLLMHFLSATKSGATLVTPAASCRERALDDGGTGHLGAGSALGLREEVVPSIPL